MTSGSTRCSQCAADVPPGNLALHELRCSGRPALAAVVTAAPAVDENIDDVLQEVQATDPATPSLPVVPSTRTLPSVPTALAHDLDVPRAFAPPPRGCDAERVSDAPPEPGTSSLSIRQLRERLAQLGVDTNHCLERQELYSLLHRHERQEQLDVVEGDIARRTQREL